MKRFEASDAQFYYVKSDGHRIGTVCLYEIPPVKKGIGRRSMYARGISICSVKDNFNPALGKLESMLRCKKAYALRENSEPTIPCMGVRQLDRNITHLRFIMNYQGYKSFPQYKSAYTSRLSSFEKKIMDVRRAMRECPRDLPEQGKMLLLTGEQKVIHMRPSNIIRMGGSR